MSCKKALEFLEQKKISVDHIEDARKNKIEESAAWEIISKTDTAFVAKGKKVLEFTPDDGTKDEILKHSMGRSGALRAPTLIKGNIAIIGFNEEMYNDKL